MEKIIWSQASKVSLKHIWDFYAEKNTSAADRIVEEIISAAENISYRDQYQVEELLQGKFRRAVVRHFKIIYKVQDDYLRIIDVFDARQHPDKMKSE